jgi:hypothetical protein
MVDARLRLIAFLADLRCRRIVVSSERSILADESLVPTRLIARARGRLVWLASIAMIASWPPRSIATLG